MSIPIRAIVPLLVCLFSTPATAQTTGIWMISEPGDPVGLTNAFIPATDTITASTIGRYYITVRAASGSTFSYFTIGVPPTQQLAPGTYENAGPWSANGRDPMVSVATFMRSCRGYGRFVVYEIAWKPDGSLDRLAADLEHHCGDLVAASFTAVRFNSSRASVVPFDGAPAVYSLTVLPPSNGTVSGGPIDCGDGRTACASDYAPGDTATLVANPAPGYAFAGWQGACAGRETGSVTITRRKQCGALFVPLNETTYPTPRTSMTLDSSPGSTLFPDRLFAYTDSFVELHIQRAAMTIVGLNDHGWRVSFQPPIGQPLLPGTYKFTTAAGDATRPGLSVWTSDPNDPWNGWACAGDGTFTIHEVSMTGDAIDVLALDFVQPCGTGVITGSLRYRSTRPPSAPGTGALASTVAVVPSLGGKVVADGIDCGEGAGDCEETYNATQQVTLTAQPSAGYEFLGWSGECAGSALTHELTARGARRCFAAFRPQLASGAVADPSFAQGFALIESSDGQVIMLPPGAGQFRGTYSFDTALFAASSSTTGFQVRMAALNQPLSPGVYEDTSEYGNPVVPRLDTTACADVRGRFVIYEIAHSNGELTALAADFEALCSTGVILRGVLRLNSSRSSVRPFERTAVPYGVEIQPATNGTVTAAGLECGPGSADCSEVYGSATTVELTAVPAAGYRFVGWTGDCAGDAATTLTVNWSRRCSAVFNSATRTPRPEDPRLGEASLFVDSEVGDVIGGGRRHIWVSDLEVAFDNALAPNQVWLTVTTREWPTWRFRITLPVGQELRPGTYENASTEVSSSFPQSVIWGEGGCVGSGRFVIYELIRAGNSVTSFAADFENRCGGSSATFRAAVRFNSERSVVLPFVDEEPSPFALTITRPSGGYVVADGIACGGPHADCIEEFAEATDVSIRAVAGPGHRFERWDGACVGEATTTVAVIGRNICSARFQRADLRRITSQVWITGLVEPVAYLQDPVDPNLEFIVERRGTIRARWFQSMQEEFFLDLRGVVGTAGEGGLLSLAFAPDYAASRRFFVSFTNPSGHLVVARFQRSADSPMTADPKSRFDLFWSSGARHVLQPFAGHRSGHLAFGPDGYLYVGFGDGGGDNDPYHLAQSGNILAGKIVRVDVNVDASDFEGFDVPADNPFIGRAGVLPEIWSFGWRNPRRFAFDLPARGGSGAMVVADAGAPRWQEINFEPSGRPGRNYGWRNFAGAHAHVQTERLAYGPERLPTFEYGAAEGTDIVGGFVYRGSIQEYRGRYFFADGARGRVWSILLLPDPISGEAVAHDLREHTADLAGDGPLGTISWFGEDAAGNLSIVSESTGRVLIINPIGPVMPAWRRPVESDMNGDGDLDLVWQHRTDGWLAAWLMDGTQLTDSALLDPQSVADPSWRIVGTPHLNPDGKTDILWQNDREGWIAGWIMDGTRVIESVGITPERVTDTNWKIVATADVNGDGHSDFIWRHRTDGWLAVWLMEGTTLRQSVSLAPERVADPDWTIAGAGDFNVDGHVDLLWWNQRHGWLVVWEMQGTRLVASVDVKPERIVDVTWVPVSVADVNGDGRVDIIWQNVAEGWIGVWLMTGRSLTSSLAFSVERVPDTGWRIVGPR